MGVKGGGGGVGAVKYPGVAALRAPVRGWGSRPPQKLSHGS